MQAEAVGWLLRVCEGLGNKAGEEATKALNAPLRDGEPQSPLAPRVAVGKAVFLNEDLWPI